MKIKYLIFRQGDKKSSFEVAKNLTEFGVKTEDIKTELYTTIEDLSEKINNSSKESFEKKYTHIVILNHNDVLSKNFIDFINNYSEGRENTLLMPIIHVKDTDEEGNAIPKGFFNTCLWEGQLNDFYTSGIFTHQLSLKQIDLSIFGCLIPLTLLVDNPINSKSNIYFGNEWLNRVSKKIDDSGEDEEYDKFDIIGIPKILLETFYSSDFKAMTKEDKIKYFNIAKEEFTPAPIQA